MPSGIYTRTKEHNKNISLAMKGHKFSEETKQKIRNTLLGRKQGPNHKKACKGIKNGMYGKKRPDLVLKNKLNPLPGDKNPAWLGGKSFEPYGPEFNKRKKREIKTRDNFTCQLCGDLILNNSKNKFLTIHHIDYNKLNNQDNNLITLCNFCNSSVNTSRDKWTVFFNQKIQGVK